MKAKEVHAILGTTLAPWCRANGYSRLGRTASAWSREGRDAFHIVRIHLDAKFGYLPTLGGRMRLRAWRSNIVAPQPPNELENEELPTPKDLLPDALLRRMKELSDQVTRKVLAGDWTTIMQSRDSFDQSLMETTRADFEEFLSTPYSDDLQLNEMVYLDADDVTGWAGFLLEALPHIAAALSERDQ